MGIYLLATIVGVTDIDPFVLSIAQGGVAGLDRMATATAILVAASSNNEGSEDQHEVAEVLRARRRNQVLALTTPGLMKATERKEATENLRPRCSRWLPLARRRGTPFWWTA